MNEHTNFVSRKENGEIREKKNSLAAAATIPEGMAEVIIDLAVPVTALMVVVLLVTDLTTLTPFASVVPIAPTSIGAAK